MNDHIGEPNEMSDTPISDSTPHNVGELGMLCRKLERDVNDGIDRIKRLIAERDTARMQAAQKVDLRKEFRHLLGTDDVQTGITVVCDLKQLAAVRLGYIQQLETDIERLTNKVAQLYEGAEEAKQRIQRLEDAGDVLAQRASRLGLLPMAIEGWHKAKEAKP